MGEERVLPEALIRRALDIAARGPRGANPLVGALLLGQDGSILAEGYHRGAGSAHAEAAALAEAQRKGLTVTGATMIVTLEPCDHEGRTPACSQALLSAGIARVHFLCPDKTPTARGGAETLADAGVKVSQEPQDSVLFRQAQELNARWFKAQEQGRPFISAKVATSLDFKIAARDSSSQWITSAASREHAQGLRARADAVLVGTQTVFDDNPRLNARNIDGDAATRQPYRVAMGLRTVPEQAAIRAEEALFISLATRDPLHAARSLRERGIEHLMIEGGASILGAFMDADLVDELWHYQAPCLIHGGKEALKIEPLQTLSQARRFETEEIKLLGPDLFRRMVPSLQAKTSNH